MKSSKKEPKAFVARKIDAESVLPEEEEALRPVAKAVKKTKKKVSVSLDNLPDDANKNTIVQTISTALETKGISKEMGKHQGVIHISEGYKKKIYMSRPSAASVHCYYCRQNAGEHFIGNPIRMKDQKYMMEGSFCSFNCLLAFQQEQNSVKYRESGILIHYLYRDLFRQPMKVLPSKSWKLLQEYGGEQTVKQWRNLSDPFVILSSEQYKAYQEITTPSSELFIGD